MSDGARVILVEVDGAEVTPAPRMATAMAREVRLEPDEGARVQLAAIGVRGAG